jgi:hypothetical protein
VDSYVVLTVRTHPQSVDVSRESKLEKLRIKKKASGPGFPLASLTLPEPSPQVRTSREAFRTLGSTAIFNAPSSGDS